jgi:hypothetical protein
MLSLNQAVSNVATHLNRLTFGQAVETKESRPVVGEAGFSQAR